MTLAVGGTLDTNTTSCNVEKCYFTLKLARKAQDKCLIFQIYGV